MTLLNLPPRTCDTCVSAALSSAGVFCREFLCDVDEREAEKCEAYEPDSVGLIAKPDKHLASQKRVIQSVQAPVVDTETLRQACQAHLAIQPSTLWGRSWDVKTDGQSREQAVDWLTDQVRGVLINVVSNMQQAALQHNS